MTSSLESTLGWLTPPPPPATSADVRRHGLGLLLRGLGLMALGGPLVVGAIFGLRALGVDLQSAVTLRNGTLLLAGAPFAIGYVLTMVGLFRAVTGRATATSSGLASMGRILLGLALTLVGLVGVFATVAFVGGLLRRLSEEAPNGW